MDNQNRRADDKRAPGQLQWDGAGEAQAPAPARYSYEITPRKPEVGGGWRLQLMDGRWEAGGAVYPVSDETSADDAYQEALDDGEAWLMSRGDGAATESNNWADFIKGCGYAEVAPGRFEKPKAAPASADNPSREAKAKRLFEASRQMLPRPEMEWSDLSAEARQYWIDRVATDNLSTAGAAQGGNTNDITGSWAAPSAASIEGLTNSRIIEIAHEARAAESRDGDYILPISFARAIERELRATQSAKQGVQPDVAQIDRALIVAEAALGDIGDADREPGDDLAWCEARAAEALPVLRSAMLSRGLPISGGIASQAAPEQAEPAQHQFRVVYPNGDGSKWTNCEANDTAFIFAMQGFVSGDGAKYESRQLFARPPAAQVQADLSDEEITEAAAGIYLSHFDDAKKYDIAVARAVIEAMKSKRAASTDGDEKGGA